MCYHDGMDAENASERSRKGGTAGRLVVLVLLLAFTLLIRLPDLDIPLERDEGEYAYAAQEILRGRMPYADSFCQKPPVVFLWYLAGMLAFGETVVGIHLIMVLAAALGSLGVYLVIERLTKGGDEAAPDAAGAAAFGLPRFASWFGALAFALAAAGDGYFGSAANTEIFMLVPVVYGTLFLLKALDGGARLHWFLAGLFFGGAFMTKQVALFSLLGPGICAAWILCSRRRSARGLAGPLLLGAAGACAAAVPICVWLAARGAFGHFLEAALGFNVSYVGSPFGAWKWEQMLGVLSERFLFTNGLLWAAALACLVLVVFHRRTRGNGSLFFVMVWLLGSLFGVALGPRTFPHYFLQVLPPLAVAAALVIAWIGARTAGLTGWRQALPLAVAVLILVPLAAERFEVVGKSAEERSFELYGYYGAPPFAAAAEIGKHLEETTEPDDRILVVGSEPEILFHARRRSATRFTIFYPLTGTFAGSDAMLAELLGEIEKNRPARIVLAREGVFFVSGRESPEEMMLIRARVAGIFDFVQRFVAAGYVEEDLVFGDDAGRVLWKSRNGEIAGRPPLFHIFTLRE